MGEALLLDTHVWLWIVQGSDLIVGPAKSRIAHAAEQDAIYIAAYSFFEVAYAAQRGRMNLKMSLDTWFNLALGQPSVKIAPFTREIAVTSTTLPPEFHGDPGDRIIAATAKHLDLVLCTHDRALLRIGHQGEYKFLEI